MLTYRCCVYKLATTAAADAITLAASIASWASNSQQSEDRGALELARLQREAATVQRSVDRFLAALPSEVFEVAGSGGSNLRRHLYFTRYWIDQGNPRGCMQDPLDVAKQDIPHAIELFDGWYDRNSPSSSELSARLDPLIASGQLNAALRETWAIFKSRVTSLFGLPEDLDGHRLVDRLFAHNGPTVGLLSSREQQAHSNLLKGLYSLYRNPVVHNDTPTDPEATDAVLALFSAMLSSLETMAESQWNEREAQARRP